MAWPARMIRPLLSQIDDDGNRTGDVDDREQHTMNVARISSVSSDMILVPLLRGRSAVRPRAARPVRTDTASRFHQHGISNRSAARCGRRRRTVRARFLGPAGARSPGCRSGSCNTVRGFQAREACRSGPRAGLIMPCFAEGWTHHHARLSPLSGTRNIAAARPGVGSILFLSRRAIHLSGEWRSAVRAKSVMPRPGPGNRFQ